MRVTVCQLRNDPDGLEADWAALGQHAKSESSDLILLPEMAFAPWPFWRPAFDSQIWDESVAAHAAWEGRLQDLAPARVLFTRPMNIEHSRFNVGQLWQTHKGSKECHRKRYLPDEAGFWEASWYDRGDDRFDAFQCGAASAGMLICTEIWFMEHARHYGQAGVHILVTPRATERDTRDKWLAGGRAAAVIAGAYGLSSNLVNDYPATDDGGASLGGQGWIVDPDGAVLALTDTSSAFVTVEVDLAVAERAKSSYPRYVRAG
jgi:N-carbamoylputrescine amidase